MRKQVRVIDRATGEVVEDMVLTNRQAERGWDLWWAMNGNWKDFRVEETDLEEEEAK